MLHNFFFVKLMQIPLNRSYRMLQVLDIYKLTYSNNYYNLDGWPWYQLKSRWKWRRRWFIVYVKTYEFEIIIKFSYRSVSLVVSSLYLLILPFYKSVLQGFCTFFAWALLW